MPKIGRVKIVLHKPQEGRIKIVTVSITTSKYYASLLCDIQQESQKVKEIEKIVGIDLGLHDLFVSSDNLTSENLCFLK